MSLNKLPRTKRPQQEEHTHQVCRCGLVQPLNIDSVYSLSTTAGIQWPSIVGRLSLNKRNKPVTGQG